MASLKVAVRARPLNNRWVAELLFNVVLFYFYFDATLAEYELLTTFLASISIIRELELGSKCIIQMEGQKTTIFNTKVIFNEENCDILNFFFKIHPYTSPTKVLSLHDLEWHPSFQQRFE